VLPGSWTLTSQSTNTSQSTKMKVYKLHYFTRLPIGIEEAWEFFSSPGNLSLITPPEMRFEVTSDLPRKVYAGMVALYRLRPLLGIPARWMTIITHVDEPNLFVDEQRFGPYRLWHHEHFFREVPEGVEIEDLIYYALPMGPLGRLANRLMVARQLKRVFLFREKALQDRFGRASQ
jgi:ligand-binding SRPBCC domain-containing protein